MGLPRRTGYCLIEGAVTAAGIHPQFFPCHRYLLNPGGDAAWLLGDSDLKICVPSHAVTVTAAGSDHLRKFPGGVPFSGGGIDAEQRLHFFRPPRYI